MENKMRREIDRSSLKSKVEILKQKGYNFLWINNKLWMFDIPEEVENQKNIARLAFGNVLVAGYGLGIVQKHLVESEKVRSVLTIEKFPEVIDVCKKTFGEIYGEIEINDFYDHCSKNKFDCIIGDIWQDMSPRNLREYEKFKEKSKQMLERNGLILGWGMEYFDKLLDNKSDYLCKEVKKWKKELIHL